MQSLQVCIGPIIRIGRESWCLPYAGFFVNVLFYSRKIMNLSINFNTVNCNTKRLHTRVIRQIRSQCWVLKLYIDSSIAAHCWACKKM